MGTIKLGILDQSVVYPGYTAKQAVEETIATAKLAENLGYSRFWISEHHNSTFIAGTAPEVLMVKLASETKKIRIGSGGVMLPNHSAFKVAENFRMLEILFPGRIDLGMGRAPGGDRVSASLLNPSNTFSEESYIEQLEHLRHFFSDTAGTSMGKLVAAPQAETTPMQWILSSSGGSAAIAAEFGMGLAVAKFINGFATPSIVEEYRKKFQPSALFPSPQAIVSIFVIVARTEEKAAEMRKFMDYIFLQFEKGKFDDFGDPQAIRNYHFTLEDQARINFNSGRIISGTIDSVREKLVKLANAFDVNEIIVSTMAENPEERRESFRLLSEGFSLAS